LFYPILVSIQIILFNLIQSLPRLLNIRLPVPGPTLALKLIFSFSISAGNNPPATVFRAALDFIGNLLPPSDCIVEWPLAFWVLNEEGGGSLQVSSPASTPGLPAATVATPVDATLTSSSRKLLSLLLAT
jgi:hypothetical protein